MLRPSKTAYLLVFILLVSGGFRFLNLDWGIPTQVLPHMPFHPDEPWGMGVLSEANISKLDLTLKEAHSEGTLLYYTLTITAALMKSLGIINEMPCCFTTMFGDDYAVVLYVGRMLGVFADLGSIFFVFLILKKIASERAGLIGAAFLGVAPLAIIYSHYMRPHMLANFLFVLVVFFSLRIYQNDELRPLVIVGMLSGLAAAVRYTTGIVALIPSFVLMWKHCGRRSKADFTGSWIKLLASFSLLGLSTIGGLFLGDPPLFLRFDSIRSRLEYTASFTATGEFSWTNLLDLSRPWEYVSYLIPQGAAPFLWVLFYASVVYVLFCKRYHKYALPLIGTAVVYLFVMAKGYASPAFVRASLPIFPIFAILSGMAINDGLNRAARRSYFVAGIWVLITFVWISTAFFNLAYLGAMDKERDPRVKLYKHLASNRSVDALRIGIREGQGLDYFLIKPTLSLVNDGAVVFVKEPGVLSGDVNLDYLVLSGFLKHKKTERLVEDLVKSGKFELEKRFQNEFSLFGVGFDVTELPHDMQYPFPDLYLLRPSQYASMSNVVKQLSTVVEAESFVRGNALVDRENYGENIGVVVTPVGASATFAEYEVKLPVGGRYEVEIRLASGDIRPLYLSVNGELLGTSIGTFATGGWFPSSQRWIYAGTFGVSDARCILRIGRKDGPIPHVDKLRLTSR